MSRMLLTFVGPALVLVMLIGPGRPVSAQTAAPSLGDPLPGTEPLTLEGDISEHMIRGVDRFLLRELEQSIEQRGTRWQRDFSSPERYSASVEPNRRNLRRIIGVPEDRPECTAMELVATTDRPALVGRGDGYEIRAIRWRADEGLHGEGLLLTPVDRPPVASVIALPDCEQTPEMLVGLEPGIAPDSQFARRLAESGCRVVVPALINRGMELSVIADGKRRGQVTHREILYRAAYQMGRHLIGYEVQKVLAAVDWLTRESGEQAIAVVGYGEGGLLSLYAGAVDVRIDVVGVSGYFNSRQGMWQEPIDRNVFGLLREFGDAELASLVIPRVFVVEACRFPEVEIPPGLQSAPATVSTPPLEQVQTEFARAHALTANLQPPAPMELIVSGEGRGEPGTIPFLAAVLQGLGQSQEPAPPGDPPDWVGEPVDAGERLARQYREISEFSERLIERGWRTRAEFTARINRETDDVEEYAASTRWYRDYLRDEIIGRFDTPRSAPNPKTRLKYDDPKFLGYEVVLDVADDVVLYGTLLLPKDLQPGERRPVVVCQHGLEGRTEHTVVGDKTSYRDFAARLARRGFITFAPQHLYRGGDLFRTLQRKANPLGKSLFAVMVMQHEQLLDWLASLPQVDAERIGFYGVSYGGKSAMRIPALLEGYCLSICSSDYSDWIWRTVSNRFESGYLAHSEYEIFEFNLGSTFNYGELTLLICPRPFMVENFHRHGVVAERTQAEFARAALQYENLGIADRVRATYYPSWNNTTPYSDRVTFDFLHEHLNWPRRSE